MQLKFTLAEMIDLKYETITDVCASFLAWGKFEKYSFLPTFSFNLLEIGGSGHCAESRKKSTQSELCQLSMVTVSCVYLAWYKKCARF